MASNSTSRSERRKIVVTHETSWGETNQYEVDRSDYRVVEEIYNLGKSFAGANTHIQHPLDLVPSVYYGLNSDGRIIRLKIPRLGNPIPESLLTLDSLDVIEMDCSDMVSIPDYIPREFGQSLKHLRELTINIGSSHFLPEAISGLRNLFSLTVHAQTRIEIPPWIGNFHLLYELRLILTAETGVRSISIPESVESLRNLRFMLLEGVNDISHENDFVLSNMGSLSIDNGNILRTFDGRLPNLHSLTGQGINTLPDEIGSFTYLRCLNLRETHFSELPRSIINLGNLQHLNLKGSAINTLPNEIGDLANLEEIDLTFTPVTILPRPNISNLQKLRRLHLSREMLISLPAAYFLTLIRELPRLGCLGYGAPNIHFYNDYDSDEGPGTGDDDMETPETIVHALMCNRIRTHLASVDYSTLPLSWLPQIINRASYLARPYKYNGYFKFPCSCCRRESIAQTDAMFQLLKMYDPEVITNGQVEGWSSDTESINDEEVEEGSSPDMAIINNGETEGSSSGTASINNEVEEGSSPDTAMVNNGETEGSSSGTASINNDVEEGSSPDTAMVNNGETEGSSSGTTSINNEEAEGSTLGAPL